MLKIEEKLRAHDIVYDDDDDDNNDDGDDIDNDNNYHINCARRRSVLYICELTSFTIAPSLATHICLDIASLPLFKTFA